MRGSATVRSIHCHTFSSAIAQTTASSPRSYRSRHILPRVWQWLTRAKACISAISQVIEAPGPGEGVRAARQRLIYPASALPRCLVARDRDMIGRLRRQLLHKRAWQCSSLAGPRNDAARRHNGEARARGSAEVLHRCAACTRARLRRLLAILTTAGTSQSFRPRAACFKSVRLVAHAGGMICEKCSAPAGGATSAATRGKRPRTPS